MGVLVPTAPIEIDGTTYTLVEDFNALATFEELTKVDALNAQNFVAPRRGPGGELIRDDEGNLEFDIALNATQFRAYVYALLRSAHPDVKLKTVGEWLGNPNVYIDVRAAMSELAKQSFTLINQAASDTPGQGSGGVPLS
jgi:hypothetical protein